MNLGGDNVEQKSYCCWRFYRSKFFFKASCLHISSALCLRNVRQGTTDRIRMNTETRQIASLESPIMKSGKYRYWQTMMSARLMRFKEGLLWSPLQTLSTQGQQQIVGKVEKVEAVEWDQRLNKETRERRKTSHGGLTKADRDPVAYQRAEKFSWAEYQVVI